MGCQSYAAVVTALGKASIPVKQLTGSGCVAVTLAAGRVIAMAFSEDGPNLFWSHPQLADTATVKTAPQKLVGGFGGDRLWFSPELAYHWDGPPDWETFANYKPPAATEPGAYQFVEESARSITLHARGELPSYGADRRVGFEVQRTIRMTESPVHNSDRLMQGVDYVGIETTHALRMAATTHSGTIDLWHLLQVPAGAVLIVPLKETASSKDRQPLIYAGPGAWIQKPDHILWRYDGNARAKLGVSAAASTGRSAVFREPEPGRWYMIVRQFPVDPQARYGDHPYGVPRSDQAFQAWDGFGFGEMEYHSPLLDAQRGPRELEEVDQLWAFAGSAQAITALAARLLECDVGYIMNR